jgi:hypothetical protein
MIACAALLWVGLSFAGAQAHDQADASPSATTAPVLTTPAAMHVEHEHLHQELATALASGGKTGEAAKQVEAVLMPHFIAEEQYAMPPLSLLPLLAQGQTPSPEQTHAAIEMTDRLRAHYDQMIKEHQQITEALDQLSAAAKEEGKARQEEFAESLKLHAKNEEEVLYPASLLVGKYLKLQGSADARH